ncbi:MAG: type II toxin-antitoxin system RelE/ParE family toxin [Phycisphaerales bacterium]
MTYGVLISPEVLDAIDRHLVYLRHEGAPPDRMEAWLGGLLATIDSLYLMPRRFPVAETVTAANGYEVRRVNHGDYSLFYHIDDNDHLVEILAFRHGRQRPWLEGEGL